MKAVACIAVLLVAGNGSLAAQVRPRAALPEVRVDGSSGDGTALELGGGGHAVVGTYVRLAVIAAAGQVRRGGESVRSLRLELQGRFHVDPYRQSALGLYGIGGVAAIHDQLRGGQGRLVVGGGVELPARGSTGIAIETALAGGVRVSLVARRLRQDRR